jgi:AcrR family transcriptional regulator
VAHHQRRRIREGLLEIIAEQGYAGLTVRQLAGRAGVSTRSFYQHYPNKEACFLAAHQNVTRRVLQGVEAARLNADRADRRLALAVDAIVGEWASDPRAARLMLLDAYAAGASSLKQARLASRSIEARIGECLDYGPEGAGLEPLAAEAVVAGIVSAVRSCLLDDQADLDDLRGPLGRWAATSYPELPDRRIEDVAHLGTGDADASPSGSGEEGGSAAPDGDRGLLLAATARIVAARGDAELDLEEIAAVAGISRRGFEAEFADPEACVVAAHRFYADRALERAVLTSDEHEPAGEPRATLVSLSSQLAADPALATLCFSDVAISGPRLVQDHQRFLRRIACLIVATESPSPAAEAAAGALWGPLRQRVVMGRATRALELTPTLAALVLHPFRTTNQAFTS